MSTDLVSRSRIIHEMFYLSGTLFDVLNVSKYNFVLAARSVTHFSMLRCVFELH